MTTLPDLLTRLRAATGPDRELDVEITEALGLQSYEHVCQGGEIYEAELPPLKLTASLDACAELMARVLPGWEWEVRHSGRGARLWHRETGETVFAVGRPEPCLAWLTAIVEALIAEAKL